MSEVQKETGLENNFDNKPTDDNTDEANQTNCKDTENEQQKTIDKDHLENGEEDIDPLDLIANCNEIGGDLISDNSDVWKCSDTDEESFTNQKDVDQHLIDNTEMTLIDDNIIKESSKNDDKLNEKNIECSKDDDNDDHNSENTEMTLIDDNRVKESSKDHDKLNEKNTECSKDDDNNDKIDKETSDNHNDEDKDTILSLDSPDCNDNKLTDDLDDNRIDENDKTTTTTKESSSVIINDRTDDDSGDSGISDTPTTQQNNHENFIEKSNDIEEINDNDEMDYNDFDPSLLCPEVSMAIDEAAPIITETITNNDCTSPLPYETIFSTFVDEITGAEISFNLTPEEHDTRIKRYTSANPIEYTKIHCTACNLHLGSALEAQNNRFVHPLLKVLICKTCYNFYTSGEFEKDEDGSELYCRWCGQGGQVLCCSKCECVFCKKCIKNNFGRRKLDNIKNSDDWICYKCNPLQLSYQRIACFELFEYVRRETARAATLNDPEFLSTDYSVCCKMINQTDPLSIDANKEKKKTNKKKKNNDPEYDPFEENQPAIKKLKVVPKSTIPLNNNNNNNNIFTPITTITTTPTILQPTAILLRPTSTIIQTTRSINGNMHRPHIINTQNFRPTTQTLFRINTTNQPTIVTTTTQASAAAAATTTIPTPPLLYRTLDISKHEWFEKTVRSTARVNAHLSYTLTQLNKAQSQAGSLEELAVVHNKLQEVLSSSINSLIQIRKNLRSEFITGIKKVRLPAKKFDCSNKNKDDDDVIFVSAAPSTITISKPVIIPQTDLSSSTIINNNNNNNNNNINKDSIINNGDKVKGFLKVKSVFELQNVPSECITIPDEPSSPNKDDISEQSTEILIDKNVDEKQKKSELVVVEKPSIEKINTNSELLKQLLYSNNNEIKIDSIQHETSIVKEQESNIIDIATFKYNLNDPPTPIVKRMKSVYVRMERSPLIK